MEKAQLLCLVNEGLSVRQIANEVGLTPTPVRYWLKKYDLKTKNQQFPRRWTDDELAKAVAQSKTRAEVLRHLGLLVRHGNYETIRKHIARLGLKTDHLNFNGKNHGTGGNPPRPLSEWLVKNGTGSRRSLKKRLLKEGLLGNKCALCPLEGTWNSKPLVMVLDHINGDPLDNRLPNLRMLCPNCNSQQPTFCRGKRPIRRSGSHCGD